MNDTKEAAQTEESIEGCANVGCDSPMDGLYLLCDEVMIPLCGECLSVNL